MVLSSQQQMLIDRQASSKATSIPLTYLIWVLTGAIGGHRFYLGKSYRAWSCSCCSRSG
jgi:hypothetical protein